MSKTRTILLLSLLLCLTTLSAQQDDAGASTAKPRDMWEVGIHGGGLIVTGDVDPKLGYAGGIHIRKATDYLFSLRLDLLAGNAKGENEASNVDRFFDTKWFSGTAFGVMSLNAFRSSQSVKKFNAYAMVGGGFNSFECTFCNEEIVDTARFCPDTTLAHAFAPHAALGAGLAFRINPRINIALEYQVATLFGRRSDLVDGSELEAGIRTPFRDLLHYGSLRINFNLGNPSKQSEPLYWKNPFEVALQDVAKNQKRTEEAIKDTDADGVIDAVDQEPDTPSNAPVDTRGRTLDSDKDGIADYRDKEPFYPPRAGERVNADGVVVNPITPQGGGVSEDRVKELINEALENYRTTGAGASNVTEWFLPMIHFGTDSYSIKYSDYGTLASIGRMLKANANLKLVVIGHTDQTGSEEHNDFLSYQRAKSVVDHLVATYGIGRGRLVLHWKGKGDALVPSSASYMNRRVEFRAATAEDVEMDPPAKANNKTGGF